MKAEKERTKAYYETLAEGELCDCAYCKNFYARVKAAYPLTAAFLAGLGAEIEKPFETMPMEPEDGFLEYCAQYLVFGECEDDFSFENGETEWRKALSHPSVEAKEPYFVLECFGVTLRFEEEAP